MNTYLAYTVSCSGQLMGKSGTIQPRTGKIEDFVGLNRIRIKNLESKCSTSSDKAVAHEIVIDKHFYKSYLMVAIFERFHQT